MPSPRSSSFTFRLDTLVATGDGGDDVKRRPDKANHVGRDKAISYGYYRSLDKFRHIYLATHASMRDRDLKLALPERRRDVVPFVVDCSDLNVPAERSNARVQKECDKSCNQRHRRRRGRRPPFGGTHVHVGTPAI